MKAEILSSNGRPRLRIQLPLSSPAPIEASPRPEPKTIDIKLGTTVHSFRYWKTKWTNKKTRRVYTAYELAPQGGRRKEKRSSFKALRARCQELAIAMENGETARLQLTPADQACYLRAKELLTPVGHPLERVADIYTQCVQILGGTSLVEAAKFYAHHHPAGQTKNCPEIYNDMIAAMEKDGAAGNTLDDIKSRIGKWFIKKFPGPVTAVTAAELNEELRKLDVSRRTRNNYRGNVVDFIRYCKKNGHLPKTWAVLDDVPRVKNEKVVKEIFTPEEFTKILAARMAIERGPRSARTKTLIPFMAIGAWAHCRHEEMAPEDTNLPKLDWRDINFETGEIHVSEDVARKVGMDRIVVMSKNLVEWLKPYAKNNGPICELANPTNALLAAAAAAGVKWKDNGMRKSSISYRLSLLKDIEAVAEEAGTSPERIRLNYKVTIPEREGKRWYNIWPTSADVVQVNFEAILKAAQR